MKIHALGWLITLPALVVPFASCGQSTVACTAAHAGTPNYDQLGNPINWGYAATFTPKGAVPECAATTFYSAPVSNTTSALRQVTLDKLKGDIIGFETYHPAKTTPDGNQPDFTKGSVAIKSQAFGFLLQRAEDKNDGDKPYAIGDWTSIDPDADDLCYVSNIKAAQQDLPKVDKVDPDPKNMDDPGLPEQAAVNASYEWSNVKVYVTAAATGTQFSADLKYTQNDCSVNYTVLGVWPPIGCAALDDKGNLTDKPDNSACCPNSDPVAGRATGSGINPDFAVKCDPDLLLCVLNAPSGSQSIPVLGGKDCPLVQGSPK